MADRIVKAITVTTDPTARPVTNWPVPGVGSTHASGRSVHDWVAAVASIEPRRRDCQTRDGATSDARLVRVVVAAAVDVMAQNGDVEWYCVRCVVRACPAPTAGPRGRGAPVLGLLIDEEHDCGVGWVQVEADDVAHLVDEQRVGGRPGLSTRCGLRPVQRSWAEQASPRLGGVPLQELAGGCHTPRAVAHAGRFDGRCARDPHDDLLSAAGVGVELAGRYGTRHSRPTIGRGSPWGAVEAATGWEAKVAFDNVRIWSSHEVEVRGRAVTFVVATACVPSLSVRRTTSWYRTGASWGACSIGAEDDLPRDHHDTGVTPADYSVELVLSSGERSPAPCSTYP